MILYYLVSIVLCCHLVTTEDSFSELIDAIHDKSGTLEENQNYDNLNIPVEVITDVPVDIVTTFTKIGEIEVNAEVHEVVPKDGQSSAPEIAVVPDLGGSALPEANFDPSVMDSDDNPDDRGVIDHFKYMDIDNSDRYMRPYQLADDNSTDGNSTDPQEKPQPPPLPPQSPLPPLTPPEEIPETPKTPTEAPKKTYSIWPIILVAIIFLLFILMGLIWAIITFCKTKRQEDEEEKQLGTDTPPPSAESDASGTSMAPSESPNVSSRPTEAGEGGTLGSSEDSAGATMRSANSGQSADSEKSPSSSTPSTSPAQSSSTSPPPPIQSSK